MKLWVSVVAERLRKPVSGLGRGLGPLAYRVTLCSGAAGARKGLGGVPAVTGGCGLGRVAEEELKLQESGFVGNSEISARRKALRSMNDEKARFPTH